MKKGKWTSEGKGGHLWFYMVLRDDHYCKRCGKLLWAGGWDTKCTKKEKKP